VGLAGFLAIACTALVPRRKARVAALALASGAGLAGVLLLTVQFLVGHYCPYCCVADASGMVALAAASWDITRPPVPAPAPGWIRVTGGGMVALAVGVPLLFGLFKKVTVPAAIAAEMAGAPGKVTVVDFVDFECPFCRMTHQELEPVLEAHRARLHVVRRQVPLHSHAHAQDAARAACCAEQLGKGDAMAGTLFTAPVDDLTPQGCEQLAQKLGISLDPYRACVVDPATDARIEKDREEFKAAGGYALPTIWIGRRQLVGAQSREAIAKALDEEIAASGG
jgi:protein-disulfide isomerase